MLKTSKTLLLPVPVSPSLLALPSLDCPHMTPGIATGAEQTTLLRSTQQGAIPVDILPAESARTPLTNRSFPMMIMISKLVVIKH
jgi:hypothetical protein